MDAFEILCGPLLKLWLFFAVKKIKPQRITKVLAKNTQSDLSF